jgi:hypothetical protein
MTIFRTTVDLAVGNSVFLLLTLRCIVKPGRTTKTLVVSEKSCSLGIADIEASTMWVMCVAVPEKKKGESRQKNKKKKTNDDKNKKVRPFIDNIEIEEK